MHRSSYGKCRVPSVCPRRNTLVRLSVPTDDRISRELFPPSHQTLKFSLLLKKGEGVSYFSAKHTRSSFGRMYEIPVSRVNINLHGEWRKRRKGGGVETRVAFSPRSHSVAPFVRLCEEETNHHLFGMPFAFCEQSLPAHTFIVAKNLGALGDSNAFGNRKDDEDDSLRRRRRRREIV